MQFKIIFLHKLSFNFSSQSAPSVSFRHFLRHFLRHYFLPSLSSSFLFLRAATHKQNLTTNQPTSNTINANSPNLPNFLLGLLRFIYHLSFHNFLRYFLRFFVFFSALRFFVVPLTFFVFFFSLFLQLLKPSVLLHFRFRCTQYKTKDSCIVLSFLSLLFQLFSLVSPVCHVSFQNSKTEPKNKFLSPVFS
jgi:hypothetical protein